MIVFLISMSEFLCVSLQLCPLGRPLRLHRRHPSLELLARRGLPQIEPLVENFVLDVNGLLAAGASQLVDDGTGRRRGVEVVAHAAPLFDHVASELVDIRELLVSLSRLFLANFVPPGAYEYDLLIKRRCDSL